MRSVLSRSSLLAAAALVGTALSSSAATFYWDGATVTADATSLGGTGTWTVGASGWEDGATAVNWSDANDAIFAGTAGTVTLGGNISAGTITLNTAGYTFAKGGFNLSLSSLSGTGGVTFRGAGNVSISGASSGYSGAVTLGPGSAAATDFLTVGNNASLGTGTLNMRGGILQASTSGLNLSNAINVAAGGFRVGGTNSFTLSGLISMDGTSRTFANYSSNASTVTLSGGISTLSGSVVSFDNAAGAATGAPIVVSGAITGSGALEKTGAGVVTLSGNNTYTGNTVVSSGTLKVSGAGAHLYNGSWTNSNTVTINTGGTLELDSFAYQGAGGTGQLADYGARRVINGGTINVVGSTHSSGNNFQVANGSTGTFNYNAAAGQTLTLSGNGNDNIAVGGVLTFGGTGNITVNETIDSNGSNGSIVYAGTGTLQLGAFQGINSVTTLTARSGGIIRLAGTNMFVSGHGVALAANRSIVAEGTGSVVFAADFRVGNLTLNNGGTITSNIATGGYGILLANNVGGASTVTVSGTYTAAARLNGSGGMNMQGVQNFAVADINTTGTDSGQDLIVSMVLANPNTSGGDAGGITKSGAGTMVLTNTGNSFGGAVTVNAGTLIAQGVTGGTNTTLGVSSGSRTVTVNSGATLALSGANVLGGGSQTLANTIKIVVNGGTLTNNNYNVVGNIDLNGAVMTATAGNGGSYQTYEFNGSTVTVGGSAASTMSSSAASNGGYHLGGNRTLTLAVADVTASSATDLTVSAALLNGSNDRPGAGALLKTGEGTVLFSGSNTYTGGLTHRAGTIIATNSGGLGNGTVTLGDASTGTSNISVLLGSVNVGRAITVSANGTGTVTLGANGAVANPEFSGRITLAKDVTLTGSTNTDRMTFTGGIDGTGNVTVTGPNRVMFLTGAHSYTGNLTVASDALLQLHWGGAANTTSYIPDAALLTVNGTLRLAKGGASETVGGLSGTGTIVAFSGSDTLIVGNGNATASFAGILANSGATLAFTKTGTGTQTLTGANTYTGATAINNGTLALGTGGSLGNTAVSVASGATFSLASGTSVSGATSLSSGATLVGFGTAGVVNVQSGGKIIAGNGTSGSLTVGNLTFAGTGVVDIGAFTNYTSTAAITAGTLTASGTAGSITINLGGGGAVNGSYNLISFSGASIAGTGLSAFTLGTKPTASSRQTVELQVNNSMLQYVVSGATPYWTGLESASWSTVLLSGDGNWKLDTTNVKTDYEATDAVVFNDNATNLTATIDQANITPTSVTVTGSKDFIFDGAFGISSGLIAKSGTGTLTILTANAFSGGTTLTGGRIRAGTDTALGQGVVALNGGALSSDSTSARTLANAVTIGAAVTLGNATDTGALTLSGTVGLGGSNRTLTLASDATLSGIVSDGGITKAGSGTLTLSAANTYSLGTIINEGILRVGSDTALGLGAVSLTGGSLDLNGRTLANNITLTSGSITGTGTINGSLGLAGGTLAWSGPDLVLGGVVSNGTITKSGDNALTLSGANTYSGGTTLSAGSIRVGSATALGNGTLTLSGGRLSSNNSTARTLSNAVSLTASSTLGDSTLSGALTLSGAFDLGGNGPVLSTDSAVTLSGVVSNGTLRKAGSGTLTLSGANTYTGGTVINAGVLEFATVAEGSASNLGAGSASTGFISLVNGTLRYTGAGSVTTTRELFANNGTGTIDVSQASGTLTFNPGGGTVNRAFTKSGSGTLDLGGTLSISGSGNTLTVAGGNLILRSTHSYTGATTIADGATLTLSTANYTKALATSGITLGSGSTLVVTGLNVLYDAYGEIPITVNGGTIRLSYTGSGWHQHLGALNLNGGTLTATATAAPFSNQYSTFDGTVTVAGSSRSVISGAQSSYGYALNMSGLGRGTNVFDVAATGDASGVDLLVSAPLLSGGSLTKTGNGVMSLTGANTYTGGTIINAGTLSLGLANTANGTIAGAVTVNSGATLRIAAHDALGYTNGRGIITVNSGGTMRVVSGVRTTLANNLTLNGGTLVGTGNGDTWGHVSFFGSGVVATSDVSGNAAVIDALVGLQDSGGLTTFNVTRGAASPASDLNVTGRLLQMNGSTNGIRKTGTGVMTLSGTNTFVGGTTVDAGLLRVASGGRLYHGGYYGSVASTVTVNSGGTLELQNWAYGETTQSLGGLDAQARAVVVNGGTIRIAGTQATSYGRGVTVNSGGATLEAGAGASWTIDTTNDSNAWVYNGNPTITLAGSGNGTFQKVLEQGTGALVKNGSGTWTISGSNTFSGGTTINGGTLAITNVLALGTGSVTVLGGFLDLGGLNPTNLITLSGGSLLNFQNWAPTEVVLSGNVDSNFINSLPTAEVKVTPGSTVNLTGVTKDIVFEGGTLTNLAGYGGKLTVSGGSLDLSAGVPSGEIEVSAGGTVNFGSTASDRTIKFTGGSVTGANFTGNIEIVGSGVTLGSGIQAGTVRLTAGNTATIASGFNRDIAFAGGELSGLANYTGTVSLETGATLTVNDATQANVTLAAGSTLKGEGTIDTLIQSSGSILAPGNSPGLLTTTTFEAAGGAILEVEFFDPTGFSGLGYDAVSATNLDLSDLDPSNRYVLKLISLSGLPDTEGPLNGFDASQTYAFDVFTYANIILPASYSGGIADLFTIDLTRFQDQSGVFVTQGFTLSDTGSALVLNYAPIPEPSTYGLILGGLALAGAALRRRKQKTAK